jgi:hypothetical protein
MVINDPSVHFGFDQARTARSDCAPARAALADSQPLVEPINRGPLAFALEQDEQSSTAKPAAFVCQLAQSCPQSPVRRPADPIADYRANCGNQATGPALLRPQRLA